MVWHVVSYFKVARTKDVFFFFFAVLQPYSGPSPLIVEVSRSHSSVGLLWTRHRPIAETSTDNTQRSQKTHMHAFGGVRNTNWSKRAAADLRLRLRGHRDALQWRCIANLSLRTICRKGDNRYDEQIKRTTMKYGERGKKIRLERDKGEESRVRNITETTK